MRRRLRARVERHVQDEIWLHCGGVLGPYQRTIYTSVEGSVYIFGFDGVRLSRFPEFIHGHDLPIPLPYAAELASAHFLSGYHTTHGRD